MNDARAATTPADAAGLVVLVADRLRRSGVDVPLSSVTLATSALALVGPAERERARVALRACLIHAPEEHEAFEAAFAEVFGGPTPVVTSPPVQLTTRITLAMDTDEPPPQAAGDAGTAADELALRYSRVEVLRHADLAALSDAEQEEALRLIDALSVTASLRSSRRLRPTRHDSGTPDLRRTVRAALATGGEPLRRRYRRAAEQPRRLVLLIDVSGSMQPYARGLLRFGHAAAVGRRRVEVFAFATRLTRLTRQLGTRDPDEALHRVTEDVRDYASGTRLGETLEAFCDRWGVAGVARGAIVVVLSDGWDRGEPALLAEQLQRLRRVAHRLIWVNPLKAAPGYAPLAAGMAAALPHVDEFVEGHSVASLEALAEVIATGRS